MPARLRVYDLMTGSTLPQALGLCASDVSGLCAYLNEAIPRLVQAGTETGWHGTFAEMVFNVSQSNPYITCPREVARIINLTACNLPIRIQNQFYEFLLFGVGRKPTNSCQTADGCQLTEGYARNNVVTFADFPAGYTLRVYPTDAADNTLRTLIQGTDTNDNVFYSIDGTVQVMGEYLYLAQAFQDLPFNLNTITGIQKDVTSGAVKYYAVNPVDGTQTLLLTMAPGETTASYTRYYLNGLPVNCCNTTGSATTVQVNALVKLDFVPVSVPTDYTLINNVEAIRCECEAIRFSGMDNVQATGLGEQRHRQALRALNRELQHYLGRDNTAINFKPFGNADLWKQGIGVQS